MNDENDEKECENVNERCVNMILQKCVTKPGPDNFLEQNLKRIMGKKPQKYQIDPNGLLRRSLKKVVCGRLGSETVGVRRLGQSPRQKQSGVIDPGHNTETDIGVVGSPNDELWGSDPTGLGLGGDGRGDKEPGEEELVIETILEHHDELSGKPATDPPDNLERAKWGQSGEINSTDVALASEDDIETNAHRLSSMAQSISSPEGESLESGLPGNSISGSPPAPSVAIEDSPGRYGPEEGSNPFPTSTKLGHKGLQDFVASPQAVILTSEMKRACGELMEGSGEEERTRTDPPSSKLPDSRGFMKPRCGMVLRRRGEEDQGPLEIGELQESDAAAWTVSRDRNSRAALLTLIDTGNQAVSCMPEKLFKRLCRLHGHQYELETYPAPIVGVGSKRIKVFGRLVKPLAIFFDNLREPAEIRFLVISSLAKHINIGLRDLENLEVTLELSKKKGNFMNLRGGRIRLYGKQDAASTAESQDPSQVLAYVNEMNMVNDQELGEMELMKKTRAERKLRSWASPDQVLSLNRGVYSWTSLREALETPWASVEEVQGLTKNDRREVDKHLDKVVKESREGNAYMAHTAKVEKKIKVPARTFLYVSCRTTFPYGTVMACSPTKLDLPLLVPHCGLQRKCPSRLVHVPAYNIGDEDIHLEAGFPLAFLEAGEVKENEKSEKDVAEATELEVETDGEGRKCGEHRFNVSLKSTQGHELLPAEGGVDRGEVETSLSFRRQPAFSDAEIDAAAEQHREEYLADQHQGEDLAEEGRPKKMKVRDALAELENLPKTGGEWVRGEIRPLGQLEEVKEAQKVKRKYTVENGPLVKIREVFQKRLNLAENEYLANLPEEIRMEVEEEVINLMIEGRSAFTIGDPNNEFEEQIGACDWFQYQLVLKEPYRDTIFYEKPRMLSREDTAALKDLLEDWQSKGLIRKNNPTVGKQGSPHSLPLFLVKKKTGGGTGLAHRGILDCRRLNSSSIHRQVYLGSVQANLSTLEKFDLFSNCDVASFFNSILLSETPAEGHTYSSTDYCSFQTHNLGSFSYLRAPQGLHQSTSLASYIMERLTRDMPMDLVKYFADDVVLCSRDDRAFTMAVEEYDKEKRKRGQGERKQTEKGESRGRGENREERRRESRVKLEELSARCRSVLGTWRTSSAFGRMMSTLKLFLERVIEAKLRLQLRKCEFFSRSIVWLGFEVSNKGIQIPSKMKADLLSEKPPSSPNQLRSYLGRLLYFRQHVLGFSHYSARLHEAATRPPKNWKLTPEELSDFFMLKKAFLTSTAIGYLDVENLDKNRLKVFVDWSSLGLSAVVTQTQSFSEDGQSVEKEVLIGSISRKCPPALQNASSCRGEAAALMLALATFSRILKNHHFHLYSDSLSLLYLKGLRSMQGQLWRLFEEVAKHSFTMSHLKSQDNVLADNNSRRTNLVDLTDEEKELFGDVIEECEDQSSGQDGNGASTEKRKKGEPRQRRPMTAEQAERCKRQQLKQLVYAERLNRGLPLEQGEHTVGEVAHLQGVWELGNVDGERTHHVQVQDRESDEGDDHLACPHDCGHQRGWLPLPQGRSERVCVTRRGESNCVERELGGFKPCVRVDKLPGLVAVGEVEEEGEDDGQDGQGLGGGNRVPLRGHLADQLPPHEIVQKQKDDEVLGQIYKFVQAGSWPKVGVLRKQFPHPHVVKYFNLKETLCVDSQEILCRKRMPHESGRELRVILPECLKDQVFKTCHYADTIHRGVTATVKAIGDRFYYLGMTDDLRTRILSCGACFTAKLPPPKQNNRVPQLQSVISQGSSEFNAIIAADTSGRLPACTHDPPHRFFACLVDLATGFCTTAPMLDKKTASMVHVFNTSWASWASWPSAIRLDRGSEFLSKKFVTNMHQNGTKVIFTMTGAARALYAERLNRNIKMILRAVLSTCADQSGWCEALPYVTASLNTTVNSATGFSAYRLVFGKNATTPLDRLVCVPRKCLTRKQENDEDPLDPLLVHAASRQEAIDKLEDKERLYSLTEVDKAKARFLRFAQLRENRLAMVARTAENYNNNYHPMFPLQEGDIGRYVYLFTDKIPKGKSKSLTSKWVGPCELVSVISPILGVITTKYRVDQFNMPEETKAITIDRIYPFHHSHDTLCASDTADPNDLVTTLNMNDYAPAKEEEHLVDDKDDGGDDKQERLTNDLAEINQVLPDEFGEYIRPDPVQQIALTGQTNIAFDQIWKEVNEVDERLLLNDILPPGLHGEKWRGNVTRSALTQYHHDVDSYIQKKLAPPPHMWDGHNGADGCVSPSPGVVGGSSSIRFDGDDDDGDNDEQADRDLPHKEQDEDHHDDVVSSSSASDPPRDDEERQETAEPQVMGRHAAPGDDQVQQRGDLRAHSPAEVNAHSSSVSQRSGRLSADQSRDLSFQSRSIEVPPQHEQAAASGSEERDEGHGEKQDEEQEQEQKRAPQPLQQRGQSGEQGEQSPTPQAAHFTALLRRAATGADARVSRSKYEHGRPGETHISRPRRSYRSKARSRLAGGFDDVSSEVPARFGGPASVRQPGTQATPQPPKQSFGPQYSNSRTEGRGKPGVSAGGPNVDPTQRPQFNVSGTGASDKEAAAAEKVITRSTERSTERSNTLMKNLDKDLREYFGFEESPSASDLDKEASKVISGIRSSQLSSEAGKVVAGVKSHLKDISTPELAASKVAMSPTSWLSGKLGNLMSPKGSQMSEKVQSGKLGSAAQKQLSTAQISKTQQQPARQDNAGPAQRAAEGEQPARQAGEESSQRRSARVAERQAASTPSSLRQQIQSTRKRLFKK